MRTPTKTPPGTRKRRTTRSKTATASGPAANTTCTTKRSRRGKRPPLEYSESALAWIARAVENKQKTATVEGLDHSSQEVRLTGKWSVGEKTEQNPSGVCHDRKPLPSHDQAGKDRMSSFVVDFLLTTPELLDTTPAVLQGEIKTLLSSKFALLPESTLMNYILDSLDEFVEEAHQKNNSGSAPTSAISSALGPRFDAVAAPPSNDGAGDVPFMINKLTGLTLAVHQSAQAREEVIKVDMQKLKGDQELALQRQRDEYNLALQRQKDETTITLANQAADLQRHKDETTIALANHEAALQLQRADQEAALQGQKDATNIALAKLKADQEVALAEVSTNVAAHITNCNGRFSAIDGRLNQLEESMATKAEQDDVAKLESESKTTQNDVAKLEAESKTLQLGLQGCKSSIRNNRKTIDSNKTESTSAIARQDGLIASNARGVARIEQKADQALRRSNQLAHSDLVTIFAEATMPKEILEAVDSAAADVIHELNSTPPPRL